MKHLFHTSSLYTLLPFGILLFACIAPKEVLAKDSLVVIHVKDESNTSIPGALVEIPELKLAAITNETGEVKFNQDHFGSVTVRVSFMGFEPNIQKITIQKGSSVTIKVQLKEKLTELKSVTVTGSVTDFIKETPYTPEVISMKSLRATPQPITQLVGQMPGIRIRQEGGMGSQSNIMLYGIDGKGVRIFIDGIPVYLLGDTYNINNISSDMIERIEVYKGLVPVQFGSDALGGIINLVSRNAYSDHLEVSYSIGSWNTHQAGLNTRKNFGMNNKYYAQLDMFYKHSDNNYQMDDREVVIDELGNTELQDVRRFHDKYTSKMARTQLGVRDLNWADDLRLMLSASQIEKDWQHGLSSANPWGQVISSQWAINSAISWKKNSSKPDQWDATMMGGFNMQELSFTDTASRSYYWDGSYVTTTTKGESGLYVDGRTPLLRNKNLFYRGSFNYALAHQHRLNINVLTSYKRLSGEDKAGVSTYRQDPFKTPQKLFKNYTGLSLESKLLYDRVTNIASIKHFYSHSYAVKLKVDKTVDGYIDTHSSNMGFGDVLKWQVSKIVDYTLGYEYTVRQPDSEEIFGDYINVGPSPELIPEKSHNINTGVDYRAKNKLFSARINAFYRNTSDRIFLSTITSGLSTYLNLLSTKTLGVAADMQLSPVKNLNLSINGTFQDLTLRKGDDYGKVPERYIGARVPNVPYLFGNGRINYSFHDGDKLKGKLQFGYTLNYVHEFFRSWAVDGKASSKETIPTQWIHNLTTTYMTSSDRWSLGLECRNLFNEKAYDNFSIQKPGRSLYFKIRMFLNQSK